MIENEDKINEAVGRKSGGCFNCAQAVTCTYADVVGLDADAARAVASGFGTGMGNMKGTCGALVGAGMILGMKIDDRVESRAAMKRLMEEFEQKNGSTVCGDLKGVFGGKMLRDCNGCVEDACRLLERELQRQ